MKKLILLINTLLPKQIKDNGVKEGEMNLSDGTIKDIIRYYTESQV